MNQFNEKKLTHGALGAIVASAVTAFFAAGISSGIVTPQLAPMDPVAVTWAFGTVAAANGPGA